MTADVELELPKSPRRRAPKPSLPAFRPFQLCTLTNTLPVGSNWLFEIKFDGYRAQVAISGSDVRVYTRNGHAWTNQFKVILESLRQLTKGSALLDGESWPSTKPGAPISRC